MTVIVWLSFLVFILVLIMLDLDVFYRKAHVISIQRQDDLVAPQSGPQLGVLGDYRWHPICWRSCVRLGIEGRHRQAPFSDR